MVDRKDYDPFDEGHKAGYARRSVELSDSKIPILQEQLTTARNKLSSALTLIDKTNETWCKRVARAEKVIAAAERIRLFNDGKIVTGCNENIEEDYLKALATYKEDQQC